jgi:hypothetical protein
VEFCRVVEACAFHNLANWLLVGIVLAQSQRVTICLRAAGNKAAVRSVSIVNG